MLVVYALTRLNQNVDHMPYLFSAAVSSISQVLIGKQRQVELAITCLLANGHLLIEDLPGMGKTTLSHALANVFGFADTRIQITTWFIQHEYRATGDNHLTGKQIKAGYKRLKRLAK